MLLSATRLSVVALNLSSRESMAAIIDPKYRVRYTVTAARGLAAAELASMVEEGPLFVDPQHFLAVTLDGLLPPAATAADVPVTMRQNEFVLSDIGGGMIIGGALAKASCLWQALPARLATFFSDADAAGISWDKVRAKTLPKGLEELRSRFAALELTAAQRSVTDNDVTAPLAAAALGYFAHISSSSLAGSDDNHGVVFQIKAMMTGRYNLAAAQSPASVDLRATLLASLGRDVSALPLVAQAAQLVALARRTKQPRAYVCFPTDYDACLSEATRRAGSGQAELFAPLFESSWRKACPSLSTAFYHPCDGSEALSWTTGLAPCVGVSEVTDVTVDTIDSWVASISHVLDTAVLRVASNSIRQRALLAHGGFGGPAQGTNKRSLAESTDGQSVPDGVPSVDPGTWATVVGRSSYKALIIDLEPLVVTPILAADNIKIAQLLAGAFEPAGRSFLLGGKLGNHEPWKHCVGAVSMLQEAFELVLSQLIAISNPSVIAGKLLADGAAKKLVQGAISLRELDYWLLVKKAVSLKEGAHVLLTSEHADPASPAEFFSSPALMELAEPHLAALFGQAGWPGRDATSFLAFLRGSAKRAKQLRLLPDGLKSKPGLIVEYVEAISAVLDAAALRRKNTLKTPLADVLGDSTFVPGGSDAESAIIKLDADIAAVLTDLRLTPYGRSVGANASVATLSSLSSGAGGSGDSDTATLISEAVSNAMSGYAMSSASGWDSWEQWQSPGKKEEQMPKNISTGWGDAAWKNGVRVAGTNTIAFGDAYTVTCAKLDAAAAGCKASWAVQKLAMHRGKWCTTPAVCKDASAHERSHGTVDADYVQADIADGTDMSSWKVILKGLPKGGGAGNGGKGQGKGGSGKGDGGKGKGAKGGKGGKDGKGKSRGIGKRPFQRR